MNQIKYEERFLDVNGAKVPVVMMVDPSVEHIFVTGSVDYCAANETVIESAHALEHLAWTAGTKRFPSKNILDDSVSDLGGFNNAMATNSMTAFFLMLPDQAYPLGIDIITDYLFSPLLKDEELRDSVKKDIGVELSNRKRDDRYRMQSLFFQAFFPEGSYGHRPSIDERLQSLAKIDIAQITSIYSNNYLPKRAMFSVGGNFNPDCVCEMIAKAIQEKFEPRPGLKSDLKKYTGHRHHHLILQDPVEAEHLAMGFKAPDFGSNDFFIAEVLAYITGGKESARLPCRIRGKEHLSYATRCWNETVGDKSVFYIYTDAEKGKAKKAEGFIIEELLKIRNEGPTPDELINAKKALVGQLKTMDGTQSKTWRLHSDYVAAGRLIELEETILKTQAVTFDDIMRVAREVIPVEFTPESYTSARIIAK